MALLIGSRAFEWHAKRRGEKSGILHREAADFDVASSFTLAMDWITEHRRDILSITEYREPLSVDCDFTDGAPLMWRIRLRNGLMLEWELSEYSKSTENIIKLGQHELLSTADVGADLLSTDVGADIKLGKHGNIHFNKVQRDKLGKHGNIHFQQEQIPLHVPDLKILLLMKLSHLFWQFNWRKTALDLVAYRKQFSDAFGHNSGISFASIVDSASCSATKSILDEFYKTRVAETAVRWRVLHHEDLPTSPVITPEATREFQSTSPDRRLCFVQALLQSIASTKYVDQILAQKGLSDPHANAAASWLHDPSVTKESVAKECWLLALESLVTNQPVPIPDAPYHSGKLSHRSAEILIQELSYDCNAEKLATMPLSLTQLPIDLENEEITKAVSYNSVTGFIDYVIYEDLKAEFPHIFNDVVMFAIENLEAFVNPSAAYLSTELPRLGTALSEKSDLPREIWQLCLSHCDHISVCQFAQTNKAHRAVARDDQTWDRLFSRCWLDKRPRQGQDLITQFKNALLERWAELTPPTFCCLHCHQDHECVSEDDWDAYLRDPSKDWEFKEYAEFWCICPDCDANSWGTCRQHTAQFAESEGK